MKLFRVWVHMAPSEWASHREGRIMEELALEAIERHKDKITANSDVLVEVWEHGGWWLQFNGAGQRVGSANDAASWPKNVRDWWEKFGKAEISGSETIRR